MTSRGTRILSHGIHHRSRGHRCRDEGRQTQNSSGRKSDMYSRDRSSDQLLAIVGKSAIRSATTTIPRWIYSASRPTSLSWSPFLRATRDCRNFLGLRRHLWQNIRGLRRTIEESQPKNMLSFLDTEEVPQRLSIPLWCQERQSPARTWTSMPNVHRSETVKFCTNSSCIF
jgi:hypothetical protein